MLLSNRDVALSQKATFGIKGLTQFLVKLLCIWPREPVRINAQHAGKICVVLEIGKLSSAPAFSLSVPKQKMNDCMIKIPNMLKKKKKEKRF